MASESKALAKVQEKLATLSAKAKNNRAMVGSRETIGTAATVPIAVAAAAIAGRIDGMQTAKSAEWVASKKTQHPAAYTLAAGGVIGAAVGIGAGKPMIAKAGADVAAGVLSGLAYCDQFNKGLEGQLKAGAEAAAKKAAGTPAT